MPRPYGQRQLCAMVSVGRLQLRLRRGKASFHLGLRLVRTVRSDRHLCRGNLASGSGAVVAIAANFYCQKGDAGSRKIGHATQVVGNGRCWNRDRSAVELGIHQDIKATKPGGGAMVRLRCKQRGAGRQDDCVMVKHGGVAHDHSITLLTLSKSTTGPTNSCMAASLLFLRGTVDSGTDGLVGGTRGACVGKSIAEKTTCMSDSP